MIPTPRRPWSSRSSSWPALRSRLKPSSALDRGVNGSRRAPPRWRAAPPVVSDTGCSAFVGAWLMAMPAKPELTGPVGTGAVVLEPPPPSTAKATAATNPAARITTTRRRRTSSRSSFTELRKSFMASPGRSREPSASLGPPAWRLGVAVGA